jgi:Rps23 Pro-64 3,4-dihydroxylase Tpa1-like proline 4-hydroxylase
MVAMFRKNFLAVLPAVRDTLIDFKAFCDQSLALRKQYQAAQPFPHIVIDDFLPAESFDLVLRAMPKFGDPELKWSDLGANLPDGRPAQAEKFHLDNLLLMKPPLRQLIQELSSAAFMVLLGQLTGIHGLVPDAYLTGAGVHIVRNGGMLRVHTDFAEHPALNLDRRLNLLLYMNPEWKEEYGGHLELWNADMTRKEKEILPVANRCVIFNTTDQSFHGHPKALTCPNDRARQSIALYYFTPKARPEGEKVAYRTNWQLLPDERGES